MSSHSRRSSKQLEKGQTKYFNTIKWKKDYDTITATTFYYYYCHYQSCCCCCTVERLSLTTEAGDANECESQTKTKLLKRVVKCVELCVLCVEMPVNYPLIVSSAVHPNNCNNLPSSLHIQQVNILRAPIKVKLTNIFSEQQT